jgi:hypothetical protein
MVAKRLIGSSTSRNQIITGKTSTRMTGRR